MVSSNFARAVCFTRFTAAARSRTAGPALPTSSADERYFFPCFMRFLPWSERDVSVTPTRCIRVGRRRRRPGAGTSGVLLLDGFEVGFRGVAFLHDPVERVDEVV